MRDRPSRSAPGGGACASGADLTAFAHGELDGASRAALSRHLLVCAACRGRQAADRDLLARLRDLGPDWRTLVPPSPAAPASSWKAAVVGAAVAAVFLATFLVPWAPAGGPSSPAGRADRGEAFAGEVTTLLAAQRPDGSWPADPGLGGARADEGATALALLALLPERAVALENGPRARAVAQASRWLLARERESARDARTRAVTTAALVALARLSGDPGLRTSVQGLLRRLARETHLFTDDPVALRWAWQALLMAHEAGWGRFDVPLRHVTLRLSVEAGGGARPALAPPAAFEGGSVCAAALRLLYGRAEFSAP